jgi:hypothetical protein
VGHCDSGSFPDTKGHKSNTERWFPADFALPSDEYCSRQIRNKLQAWNPHKKVITFALFDNKQKTGSKPFRAYLKGLEYNVKDAALYYPDWVIRVYTTGLSEDVVNSIIALDPSRVELVTCREDSPLTKGWRPTVMMVTRFFVHDDPDVYAMISRDLDSRFSPRELMAVNQWLSSPYLFHTMRDNVQHGNAVMGGMFGMKRGCLNTGGDSTISMTGLINKARGKILVDQQFLETFVWPLVRSTALDHDIDASRCADFGSAICASWPLPWSERTARYVGEPFRVALIPGLNCSLSCRARKAE